MRKTLYFNDEQVIEKLKTVKNQSKYVSDLILADINGKAITRDDVIEMIKMYMGTSTLPAKQDTDELKNSILSAIDVE